MGCIARLGCLVLLLVLGVVAWFTRDRWLPMIRGTDGTATTEVRWEPLTPERADRARAALERLSQPTGPVFGNLSPGEAASYVYRAISNQLPQSADSAEAAVIGDRLYLRASVRVADLGGAGVLGPLAGMLSERERVQFGGTFHVIRPGLSEFRLREVRVREFSFPERAIPPLVRQIGRGGRPEGVSPDGLPLEIPRWIGDVRIANGRVTVYKVVE